MSEPWRDEETGKVFCPVNGWDCPYFKKDGSCSLSNVENECDDFYSIWSDEIESRI